jgi:hypothetical protein
LVLKQLQKVYKISLYLNLKKQRKEWLQAKKTQKNTLLLDFLMMRFNKAKYKQVLKKMSK